MSTCCVTGRLLPTWWFSFVNSLGTNVLASDSPWGAHVHSMIMSMNMTYLYPAHAGVKSYHSKALQRHCKGTARPIVQGGTLICSCAFQRIEHPRASHRRGMHLASAPPRHVGGPDFTVGWSLYLSGTVRNGFGISRRSENYQYQQTTSLMHADNATINSILQGSASSEAVDRTVDRRPRDPYRPELRTSVTPVFRWCPSKKCMSIGGVRHMYGSDINMYGSDIDMYGSGLAPDLEATLAWVAVCMYLHTYVLTAVRGRISLQT